MGRDFWIKYFGLTGCVQAAYQAKNLCYRQYDGDSGMSGYQPFGGWVQPFMKMYSDFPPSNSTYSFAYHSGYG